MKTARHLSFIVFIVFAVASCSEQELKSSARPSSSTAAVKQTENISSNGSVVHLSNAMLRSAQLEEIAVTTHSDNQKIETTGEIKSDENNVFHVSSLVGGRLIADYVSLGDYVKTQQKLALVENLEVMKISANYIHESHVKELEIKQSQTRLKLALANKARLEKLFNLRIAAEKDYLQAQTQLALEEASLETATKEMGHQREEAKAMLSAYGVDIDEIQGDQPIRLSPILCPRSGFIVKKNITVGDVINPSDQLYVVSDLSKVWLDITIFDRDLGSIKEGATISFTTDSLPNKQFKGHIDYIKPLAQDSRTFVARAILPNEKLALKPGMFGHVEIEQNGTIRFPFIPAEAVQEIDGKKVVFVKEQTGSYRKTAIQISNQTNAGYFVSSGVTPGDIIAVKGSYYLKEHLTNDPSEGVQF